MKDLRSTFRRQLVLPAICAPMTMVSHPDLVREACKAGIIGALPFHNATDEDQFEAWLTGIVADLARHREDRPDSRVGPLAVNLPSRARGAELTRKIAIGRRHGVDLFISASGDPTERTARIHDAGGILFHDVTTIAHAEKAITAGVDGLTCIGAGGGGHSGSLTPLALIPRIRRDFDGIIVMAGAISTGAGIRAAEVLGADLAYLGTRFIGTKEANAPGDYKRMLVEERADGLIYSSRLTGVPANWLRASLRSKALDPEVLPAPSTIRNYDHLPPDARPWRDLWSAGQGIDLIDDIPAVAELVERLRGEYSAACAIPAFLDPG